MCQAVNENILLHRLDFVRCQDFLLYLILHLSSYIVFLKEGPPNRIRFRPHKAWIPLQFHPGTPHSMCLLFLCFGSGCPPGTSTQPAMLEGISWQREERAKYNRRWFYRVIELGPANHRGDPVGQIQSAGSHLGD